MKLTTHLSQKVRLTHHPELVEEEGRGEIWRNPPPVTRNPQLPSRQIN